MEEYQITLVPEVGKYGGICAVHWINLENMLNELTIMTSKRDLISIITMIGKLRKILMFGGLFLREYSRDDFENSSCWLNISKRWLPRAKTFHLKFRIFLIYSALAGYTKKVSYLFCRLYFSHL